MLTASCGGSPDVRTGEPTASTGEEMRERPRLERVALATGVELQYLEQGSRNGAPVIFLHGYTDSHHSFDLNLPRLPRKYHAFALDQRGHGNSSKPACCYTQRDFAADVVAFMDALGLRKASVVGHSMGSFIAHKVAVDYPNRVDNLILIGSAPTVAGNPIAVELKSEVDALAEPIDPEFVRAFQASTFFRPVPADYLDTAVSESLKVPKTVWQQALDGLMVEDHSARLGEIRARTLILYGDQDVFFSLAEEQALHAEVRHSQLIVYEQTGHGTHAELPERVVHDIVRFLR
jgi:non-heme chloroperoxidase